MVVGSGLEAGLGFEFGLGSELRLGLGLSLELGSGDSRCDFYKIIIVGVILEKE